MSITDWAMLICVVSSIVGLVVFGFFGPEVMRHFLKTRKENSATQI